jgi:hypothetical protein
MYHPPLLHRDPRHVHPMVTRHAASTLPPRVLAATTGDSQVSPVPSSVRTALLDPHWRRAMEEEYAALVANQTWDLVPRPPGTNVVTGKWIWTHKRQADGTLERYKARWVLRGFTQRPGVDYDETFSPVVKPTTVRTVLSLALARSWPVHQLDVKNAFPHGALTETVYCCQLAGFVDSSRHDMVCRLNRSLYGLKQAPRVWHFRLATFLVTLGFVEAKSDMCCGQRRGGGYVALAAPRRAPQSPLQEHVGLLRQRQRRLPLHQPGAAAPADQACRDRSTLRPRLCRRRCCLGPPRPDHLPVC